MRDNRCRGLIINLAAVLVLVFISAACDEGGSLRFSGKKAYKHVLAQCRFGPRIPGSPGSKATGDYIIRELQAQQWEIETQEWKYDRVPLRNIVAVKGSGPIAIIGAHYDTRPLADRDPLRRDLPVPGANDGASGTAILLELARVLEEERLDVQVWLAFFDAEDSGNIRKWPWSVGAEHLAESLTVRPEYVIIVDMVGDADQQLFWEWSSTRSLQEKVWALADELGYGDVFIPEYRYKIMDDHWPFLERSVPAIDIIDFDYAYWHTIEDTPDKVSPQSLERVGRVVEAFLEGGIHTRR